MLIPDKMRIINNNFFDFYFLPAIIIFIIFIFLFEIHLHVWIIRKYKILCAIVCRAKLLFNLSQS